MSMLVKFVRLPGSIPAWEDVINGACNALIDEKRFVTNVRIMNDYNPPIAIIKHMADQSVDHMARALEAENAIQGIVESIRPLGDPVENPYADPETAYAAGMDEANRGVVSDLETVLARLRA